MEQTTCQLLTWQEMSCFVSVHHCTGFDPAEIDHGRHSETAPPILAAAAPLVVVVAVNLMMSLIVLPRLNFSFSGRRTLGQHLTLRGSRSLVSGGGARCSHSAVILFNRHRLPALRESMDAGANASVLPTVSVASLVGFGAVVAALPAFAIVGLGACYRGRPACLPRGVDERARGPHGFSLGGLTIALDALGPTYMEMASRAGIDPQLLHRIAVIGSGTLDILPHNGAVVTLLAICGSTYRESYFDIVMVGIVGSLSRACGSHTDRRYLRIVLSMRPTLAAK